MNDDIVLANEVLQVRGEVYDMRRIFRAESRVCELKAITAMKAGGLLHCFIEAAGDARDYVAALHSQLLRAKENLKMVEGVVILDRASAELKKRNLTSTRSPEGSADLRKAVVHTDPEYRAAAEGVAQVAASTEYMEGKVEKLKMAYFSVHKLLDPNDISQRNLSGNNECDEIGGTTGREDAQAFVDKHSGVDHKGYENTGFGAVDVD